MLDFFLKCYLRGICSKQSVGLPFDETSLDSRWVTQEEISVLKFFGPLVRWVCDALTRITLAANLHTFLFICLFLGICYFLNKFSYYSKMTEKCQRWDQHKVSILIIGVHFIEVSI